MSRISVGEPRFPLTPSLYKSQIKLYMCYLVRRGCGGTLVPPRGRRGNLGFPTKEGGVGKPWFPLEN